MPVTQPPAPRFHIILPRDVDIESEEIRHTNKVRKKVPINKRLRMPIHHYLSIRNTSNPEFGPRPIIFTLSDLVLRDDIDTRPPAIHTNPPATTPAPISTSYCQ